MAFEIPIKLKFRNVDLFCGVRKARGPEEKPSDWWEASALTTVPPLLPYHFGGCLFDSATPRYLPP